MILENKSYQKRIGQCTKMMIRSFILRIMGVNTYKSLTEKYNVPGYVYSQLWLRRFLHFDYLLSQVNDVDGDIVECGVGPGCSIFELSVLSTSKFRSRHIWGFDTFQGLPKPSAIQDGQHNKYRKGIWPFSQAYVRDMLKYSGIDESFISSQITLVPGEFTKTLPDHPVDSIAFLHIDCDLYESYQTVLSNLYLSRSSRWNHCF